jgi:DNA-binding MarR family transcriptional regulator
MVDLGILMGLAFQAFVDELRADLSARGFDDMSRSDGYLFRLLDGKQLTIGQIAAHLAITKQGAAQIVDDMAARGYLARRRDPTDARARLVRLAPRGERALAAARRFHARYERRLRDRCGAPAMTKLRELLGTMAGHATDAQLPPTLRLP